MADQNYNNPQLPPSGPVIQGKAKVDQPKFSERVKKFLFSDTIDSVSNYLTYYILGPSLKQMVYNLGNGALQMFLFNGQGGGGAGIPYGGGFMGGRRDPTPYNMMSSGGYQPYNYGTYAYTQPMQMNQQPPQPIYNEQQRVGLDSVSFDSKDDCWRVLDSMKNAIQSYGRCPVSEFYRAAGITGQESNWALQQNGWYDLEQARPIMRTDMRWIIQFPPVQRLQ